MNVKRIKDRRGKVKKFVCFINILTLVTSSLTWASGGSLQDVTSRFESELAAGHLNDQASIEKFAAETGEILSKLPAEELNAELARLGKDDQAAAYIKAQLEELQLRGKTVTPDDFGNFIAETIKKNQVRGSAWNFSQDRDVIGFIFGFVAFMATIVAATMEDTNDYPWCGNHPCDSKIPGDADALAEYHAAENHFKQQRRTTYYVAGVSALISVFSFYTPPPRQTIDK
jgi:hypothetical protein